MNRLTLEVIIKQQEKDHKLYDAYRNKLLNMYKVYRDQVNEKLEYDYGNIKNEFGCLDEDIQQNINYEYYELHPKCVGLFCSDMNIGIETFQADEIKGMYESEIPFTAYRFFGIWEYICKLNSVDFLIATVSLMTNVNQSSNLEKWLVINIRRFLKEFELDFILDHLSSKRVFIAMWFDNSMDAARDRIKQAVSENGYEAILIDEKEHSNSIVPEILYEIEKSNFVITDFTGNRGGVYYEAGYAKALKKKVIMTVKETDFHNIHFDTKQVSHIVWRDEEDLYNKLLKRIEIEI